MDLLLEVGVAAGNGVSCFVVVRVGIGITSVIWVTVLHVKYKATHQQIAITNQVALYVGIVWTHNI